MSPVSTPFYFSPVTTPPFYLSPVTTFPQSLPIQWPCLRSSRATLVLPVNRFVGRGAHTSARYRPCTCGAGGAAAAAAALGARLTLAARDSALMTVPRRPERGGPADGEIRPPRAATAGRRRRAALSYPERSAQQPAGAFLRPADRPCGLISETRDVRSER